MKLKEAEELRKFLANEKVATLAVPIDEQGNLHIATMNYLHSENPLRFYFMTSSKSEKCRLLNNQSVVAACSVGAYSDVPFTLQMRGSAQLLDKAKHVDALEAYMNKRSTNNENVEGPDSVLLEFTAEWARFTDYSKGWQTTMLDLS